MSEKKYFWLKLKDDFFRNKEIKKLRRIAGGDTYTIIYLKMQLLSIRSGGKIYFEGIEDSFADEIALELDESPDDVRMTLAFLQANSLIEPVENDVLFLNRVPEAIGKETAAAERMRRSRQQKNVTMLPPVTKSYTEIEIEKEIDIEIEKENNRSVSGETSINSNELTSIIASWNALGLQNLTNIKGKRAIMLKGRLKEYGKESIYKCIGQIRESPFLKGQNDRSWIITFDWLVKPANYVKVLEGNYNNKKKEGKGNGASGAAEAGERKLADWEIRQIESAKRIDIEEVERELQDVDF